MGLLWVGDAILAVVVVPLVILLANRVIRPALEIRHYADDVLQHGVGLTGTLDAVPKLVRTQELATTAHEIAGRYVAAVERLL